MLLPLPSCNLCCRLILLLQQLLLLSCACSLAPLCPLLLLVVLMLQGHLKATSCA
jgi:hypothetical protein